MDKFLKTATVTANLYGWLGIIMLAVVAGFFAEKFYG